MEYRTNVGKQTYQKSLATGGFRPHQWLTNISIASFQKPEDYVAPSVFPIVPVQTSDGKYRIFNRADLARDNMKRKPEFGHVNPAVLSTDEGHYSVQVDQLIMGIDQIQQVNNSRIGLPGAADPRIGMTKAASEQILLHLDSLFAQNFFHDGAWTNQLTGSTSDDFEGAKTFTKLTDANSEPIKMFRALNNAQLRKTRRRFNVMLCGMDAFDALINHPDILARVQYGGSTANPAVVTENVLASLFGMDRVFQIGSTINTGEEGLDENMQFICDPKAILLAYVSPTPSIDEPSAGYIFSWDPTGNNRPVNIQQFNSPNPADHAEYLEALTAFDMRKVCDDMGVFMKDVV